LIRKGRSAESKTTSCVDKKKPNLRRKGGKKPVLGGEQGKWGEEGKNILHTGGGVRVEKRNDEGKVTKRKGGRGKRLARERDYHLETTKLVSIENEIRAWTDGRVGREKAVL